MTDPTNRQALQGAVVDLFELARTGRSLVRTTPLANLGRLAASLQPPEDGLSGAVDWTLTGSVETPPGGAPSEWVDLRGGFVAPLQCQRCLAPIEVPVSIERRFRLERDARAVELDPLDEDGFDLLLGAERFDVLGLVEDEALLALPLVPVHPSCSLPGHDAAERAPDAPPHPFAALAALREPKRQD